jgi:hypothetical protein
MPMPHVRTQDEVIKTILLYEDVANGKFNRDSYSDYGFENVNRIMKEHFPRNQRKRPEDVFLKMKKYREGVYDQYALFFREQGTEHNCKIPPAPRTLQ